MPARANDANEQRAGRQVNMAKVCAVRRGWVEVTETEAVDARLWHPWLRIDRVLRVMLHTRWNASAGTSDDAITTVDLPEDAQPRAAVLVELVGQLCCRDLPCCWRPPCSVRRSVRGRIGRSCR